MYHAEHSDIMFKMIKKNGMEQLLLEYKRAIKENQW